MNGSNKASRDVFNFEEIGSQVGQEENGEWWFENATAVS